jgi:hypothetical protein
LFIIDDIINAIGAKQAADAQAKAAQDAINLQREIYGQQRADQAPWLQAGMTSLGDLAKLQNDPSSINQSAAYQFRMQQGQQALERSAAARGGLMSGGFMKGLDRYSQGLASDEYGNQWNRLLGIAQMGQGSGQSLGNMGSHYADSSSNLYGALGNANAAGISGMYGGAAGAVRSAGNLAALGMGGAFSPGGMLSGGPGGMYNTSQAPQLIPTQRG